MQESTNRNFLLNPWVVFGLPVALFCLVGYQYLIHWGIGYSSDSAMIGLMAKKIAEAGERPIYVWSVGYQGILIDAYLTAFFYRLFGITPITASLTPLFVFGLGIIVWGLVVNRIFGLSVAVLTTLFTLISCPLLYHLNTRTLPNFPEAFLIGSLFLFVYSKLLEKMTVLRFFCLGFLIGFGAYTFLISGYYFLAVFFHLVLLVSWEQPNRQLFFPHRFLPKNPIRNIIFALVVLAWINFFFGFITFFSNVKHIHLLGRRLEWDPLMHIAGTAITLGVLNALILLPSYVRRFSYLKWMGPWLLAGFLVGYSPAIFYNTYLHGKGGKGIAIRGTLKNAALKFKYFVQTHGQILNAQEIPWLSTISVLICLLGIGFFLWKMAGLMRHSLRAQDGSPRLHLISPLFLFPWIILVIYLTTSMVVDVHSGRYLVFLVSFYALALAWAVMFCWRTFSSLISRTTIGILSAIVLGNNSYALINDLNSWGDQPRLDEIISVLDQNNLKYGYCDYWTAYAVNLYTNERIILEPTISNYSPHYGPLVRQHQRLAYLAIPRDRLKPDTKEISLYGDSYYIEKSLGLHGGVEIYVLQKKI